MAELILKMSGIHKAFSGVKVLNDVGFELEKGEIHALVGGNGAGKSTLMKIMTGVYTKDAGTIEIDGNQAEIRGISDAKRAGISMIFQELSLVQSLTVSENLFLNDELKKGIFRDTKEMDRKTSEVLEKLGIKVDPKTVVSSLSVGMSQMVEIAKAISKGARILVLDEPTASLSDSETAQLFTMMRQLKEDGVSMVYISHRMNEILSIADRVTVLKDGAIVTTQKVADLTLPKLVSYIMGTEEGSNKFEWQERHYDTEAPDLLTVEHLYVNDKISDISFSIKPGQIVGFAGLMGSGRTEILETLFGLRKKRGGTVRLDGKEISCRNATEAVKHGFALIPEDRRKQGLVLMHAVKANAVLSIVHRLRKCGVFCDDRKFDKLVEENVQSLSIKTDGINKQIQLLSGGNQQKVVIAKWLNTHPRVMMFDEPTAGVDIGAKSEVIKIVRDFADEGNAVLFVSSELAELMAVCDTIITLFDGKITGVMARKEIKTEEELQNAIQRN